MADAESRREPGPLPAEAHLAAEAPVRPARTLGRGLEELSPLFLSRRRPEVPALAQPPRQLQAAPRLSAEDRGYLELLIEAYAPMGVDVAAAKEATAPSIVVGKGERAERGK